MAVLCLSGCVSGGIDNADTFKLDRTSASGSAKAAPVTSDSVSDETIVRDAVGSVDVAKMRGQPLPWANVATGSAGVIDAIVENTGSAGICRQFHTNRHAYDGVSNYYGRACLVDNGGWRLLSFRPAG